MKRICLFAGYDSNNIIHDYVIYYLKELSTVADVYYMADNEISDEEKEKIAPYVKEAYGFNHKKYDFGSWQELIKIIGWEKLSEYDELILANDSVFGPLYPMEKLIEKFILSHCSFDSQSFRDAYYDQPVTEVRLLINNECQFDCKHCFYSFKEETSRRLTDVEFLNVIDEAFTDFGVESIHFSGKEPLINDKIFLYTDYIDSKFKDKVYDIVTNGVNIPKYLDRIKGCKNLRNIFLSVDTLENEVYIRNTNKHIIKNIKLLLENNIPLQITIDLTKGNYKNIDKTVTKLIELGVKNIYARAVKPIGQGVSLTQSIITSNDFAEVLNKLEALNVGDDINLVVHVAKDYIYEGNPKLAKYTDLSSLHHEFGNMTVTLQPFCMRFSDTVTVTSDGYVLGCGMDLANPKYSELACCNVKDTTLTKALEMSRERHLSRFIGKSKQKLCPILKN